MESIQVSKKSTSSFKVGDKIILGTAGIYIIESLGVSVDEKLYYSLTPLFTATQTKTLVSESSKSAREMRHVSHIDQFIQIKLNCGEWEIVPVEFTVNSLKKLEIYNRWIVDMGLEGLLKSYGALTVEIDSNSKADKRIRAFHQKIKSLIEQEISLHVDHDMEVAKREVQEILDLML